jgi:transposase, IS30 family
MTLYTRLSATEREEIALLINKGVRIRTIALALSRSPSTISREVKRNSQFPGCYRAHYAHRRWQTKKSQQRKNKKLDTNILLRKIVFEMIDLKWSPEQIANRLKSLYPNDMNMHISHETIYSYLYVKPRGHLRKKFIASLRRRHAFRRKNGKPHQKSAIKDFLSIDERPKEIESRIIPGHWEGDLIIGKLNKSAIGTLVERTTRFTLIVPLLNHMSTVVRKAFEEQFRMLPDELKKSLTYDQGGEMCQHKLFTHNTNIVVYFTHPKSPWQRGTNENTNSLIRQYFPRGTDFKKIKVDQLKLVQNEINDRPRKVLNWATPNEAFNKLLH